MMRTLPAILTIVAALPAAAETLEVGDCNDYRSSAFNLAEPWERNTRLFAEGKIRIAVMDTTEPAAASFHLMVISPPYDELGLPQCRLVSMPGGGGLGSLTLEGAVASYDAAAGLAIRLRAGRYVPDTGEFAGADLVVTINQATGDILAALD